MAYNPNALAGSDLASIAWIEQILPEIARKLLGRTLLDAQFAELPVAQLRLVKALPANDIGETMSRLSVQLRVGPSALTQAADRAVVQGLVERTRDADDRRIVRLRLTALGRKWTHDRKLRRRARLEIIWRAIRREERTEFVDAVRALERFGRQAEALLSVAEHDMPEEDKKIIG